MLQGNASAMMNPPAILLVGPTGSGKTPLGDLIGSRGLWGSLAAHFDFGAQLRAAVSGDPPPGLSAADLDFLRDVLERGALLEDERFPIAEAILSGFIAAHAGDLIVLNGLPRHAGQAEDVGRIVHVQTVIELSCPAEVVLERIRANAGGDRANRTDDALEAVRHRLSIYAERTRPLVERYRVRGARIQTLTVGADTTADAAWRALKAT